MIYFEKESCQTFDKWRGHARALSWATCTLCWLGCNKSGVKSFMFWPTKWSFSWCMQNYCFVRLLYTHIWTLSGCYSTIQILTNKDFVLFMFNRCRIALITLYFILFLNTVANSFVIYIYKKKKMLPFIVFLPIFQTLILLVLLYLLLYHLFICHNVTIVSLEYSFVSV